MKQSLANLVRAFAVLLLFVPAPLSVVNATPAMAEPGQIVAAEPAVILPDEAEEDAEQPWTARFLGPVAVAIAVIVIAVPLWYYVVRVRGRYRVV